MEWNTGGIFRIEWNGILKIWNSIRIFGQYSGILFEYWKEAKYSGNTRKMVFRNTEVLVQSRKQKNTYFFQNTS